MNQRSSARRVAVVAVCLGLVGTVLAQVGPAGPPSPARGWRAETLLTGIQNPWGMVFLRDGRPLITGKNGTLHVYQQGRFHRIPTDPLPQLFTGGQGGLLDIALHPNYPERPWVYMTMSQGTEMENRTVLVRGSFDGHRLSNIETLFRVQPDKSQGEHFGSRLLWMPDGTLLMTVGDGGNPPLRIGGMLAREQAQNLGSHLGAILRLTEDGLAAPDNPFVDRDGALPEIWSYGHRNIQGIAREPESGRIWVNEHGPRGGDELILVQPGQNHGWPLQTWGIDYRTGERFGRRNMEGKVDPHIVWTPAVAPSGLEFYTGQHFPNWRGSLFSGGLAGQDVRRIALDAQGNVLGQTRIHIGRRVRDIRQGPDGHLYVLTDEQNGRLIRIVPDRG
jgi:aldose sugar dehydrogenase